MAVSLGETSRAAIDGLATDWNELASRVAELRQKRLRDSVLRAFVALLGVGFVVLIFWLLYQQSARVTTLAATLREEMAGHSRKAEAAALPAEAVRAFNQKLDYLELRQTAILDESRRSIERQTTIFTAVAGFFGLFGVFFAYRQVVQDSRGSDTREKQDQEMRSLVRSFQNNITTISSLISTLEQSLAYRKQIQDQLSEIQVRAQHLEDDRNEAARALDASVEQANHDAVELVPFGIERVKLGRQENRRRMETYAAQLNDIEKERRTEGRLNPFCYYARGLYNAINYYYDPALADFETASRKALEDLGDFRPAHYSPEHRERSRALLSELLHSCGYYQGVCHKNLGRYGESARKFREALRRPGQHLDSLSYLPQVMFFDKDVPFEEVETEFHRIEEDYETRRKAATNRDERDKLLRVGALLLINHGDVYHRKSLSPESRAAYRRHENPEKAIPLYWRAYELHRGYMATFGLAQALAEEGVGRTHWRDTTPRKLFAEAATELKTQVTTDYDPLYSVTLKYMQAVCAVQLGEGLVGAGPFLSQARESLTRVPTYVTCFSPVSRIRLTRTEIDEEMKQFELLSQR